VPRPIRLAMPKLRRPARLLRRPSRSAVVWHGLLIAVVLSSLTFSANARAAGKAKPAVHLTVAVSKSSLTVRVTSRPKATCTLKVAAKKKSATFPRVQATAKGKVAFRWAVPPNAPSGTWSFTVRCTKSGRTQIAKTKALIVTRGDSTGALIEPSSLHVADGVVDTSGLGGKGSGPCSYPKAVDQNGTCIGFPGNPYNNYQGGTDIGECTWYAAGRRPDLWGITTLNAYQWYGQAQAHNIPTGPVPVVGAVAVRTTVPTAASVGHVAYVVGVTASGQPIVDDANYYNDHVVRYAHTVPVGYFQHYIYGGPAGTGTSGPGGDPGGGSTGPTVPGSFGGDTTTAATAVFRPSDGSWHIRGVGDFAYGQPGDVPVPADFNGDGVTDIVVYRPSDGSWHIRGVGDYAYGQPGDIPVPGYYDGDKLADIAVYRPSDGSWHIRGVGDFAYGQPGDVPVPADFNRDGITDIAVYRPSDGSWHIRGVGDYAYGQPGDIPAVQTLNAMLLKQYGLIASY
jgi:surface antigen